MRFQDLQHLKEAYQYTRKSYAKAKHIEATLDEAYKLIREFDAPGEAKQILDHPDTPSGTLPHSTEAVMQELAFWGQHGHHRVMDPRIQALIDKLTELLKSQRTSKH